MKVRLNKYLAQCGVASRREADRMIEEGRVDVNGQTVDSLGRLIDPEKDVVCVDGRSVRPSEGVVYVMLNKPRGYLVTMKDPFGRPTIMNLLPRLRVRMFPVGRLDLDSEGLLLLTNDGDLANRLLHPRYRVSREYRVQLRGQADLSRLKRLEKGITLDGKRTAPARIRVLRRRKTETLLKVTLWEGRKRELRRMFEAIGYPVAELKRVRFGSLSLGNLRKGEWRFLTPLEVARLKEDVQAS